MLLYCRGGVVIATHDDSQDIDPALYGAGVQVIPWPTGSPMVNLFDPMPTSPTKDQLLAYAANKRWRVSVSGTTIAGLAISTDDNSQAKIGQVKQAFDASIISSTTFKDNAGTFVTVNAATMAAIYNGVVAHVQACYAAEAVAAAAINAGTMKNYSDIDSQFAGIP